MFTPLGNATTTTTTALRRMQHGQCSLLPPAVPVKQTAARQSCFHLDSSQPVTELRPFLSRRQAVSSVCESATKQALHDQPVLTVCKPRQCTDNLHGPITALSSRTSHCTDSLHGLIIVQPYRKVHVRVKQTISPV